MEKIPAACAMDWSIQLEKGLRSQKSGKSIEALEEIGRRLEWWNSESELTFAKYIMFSLIPGEDALFLNAIFLRLADAFRFGNKQIKNGVVKLFLRMKRRKKRDGKGILSKCKLENYLELLSRVKEVFDEGDVEERALALVLFGCWAYFAKDCLDIRYTVLSSLVSDDVLEVKAALYAAGCMSELSDGFANVFLEILTSTVLPCEISRGIKLAGGQAFAKMQCSYSLADKAYETGLKLLMNSSDDDFSAVLLISLSRIASSWMLLIPSQIELLTLFLNDERSLHMQATSLRCHSFILARGVGNFPSTTVHKLFGILHRSGPQLKLQIEALRVLHEILLSNISIIPCVEVPELFQKLLVVVKIMLQSSNVSPILLAISLLADLSEKVLGRVDMVSGGTGPSLASQVISFVLDQIHSLLTPKVDIHHPDFVAELEVKRLLHILFILAEEHTYLNCLVLNQICLFIDKLMKMLSKVVDPKTGFSNDEVAEFGSHGKRLVESKLMPYVSKIVVSCLQNLEETGADTGQVLDALKRQAEKICHCSYFSSYTIMAYFLILHLHSTFIYMQHIIEESMSLSKSRLSLFDSILQFDKYSLDCAKKMLGINSYWCSYKAGKSAACQGAWSTAAFIFEHLKTVVKSASSSCWINSLAQFSASEKQIQLFPSIEQGCSVIASGSNVGEREDIALRTDYSRYTENLLRACTTLISAEEILAASNTGHIFSFQIWFLTLRTKVLKTIIDLIKLLDTIPFILDATGPGRRLENDILAPCTTSQTLGPLICSAMEVSCRMKKLAKEFDLLATSFMGMDRQSVMGVSALALTCSLMAFSAGFAFLIPNLHSSENCSFTSENSGEPVHALLIEDLVRRLGHTDGETRKNLLVLLKSFRNYRGCFVPRLPTENSYNSYEAMVLCKLCKYSVGEIFSFQDEGTMVQQDGDTISQTLNNGLQLLLNIISKLMLIPFQAPHQFFQVRPSVSSELFVMDEGGQTVDGSYILSGSSLSLSLCLQLKNVAAALPGLPNKVYCILNCKTYSQITTEIGQCKDQVQLSRRDQEIDDLIDLNEKLLRYVTDSVEFHALNCSGQCNDSLVVNEYLCFELNERGQGFSTCLLDVSFFPVGSYRIKWHSGCIDSGGSYWSLLPVNAGPLFTVHDAITVQRFAEG